jgi:hypothetical protein
MSDDNDNGDGKLWQCVRRILDDRDDTSGWTADSLATQVLRADPGVIGDAESWQDFLDRLRGLLRRRGLLDGNGPGATIKALTTRELRKEAGLALSLNGDEAEAAALILSSATSGHRAGGRGRPEPTAEQVRLALDSLPERAVQEAEERREQSRLADVLSFGPPRPRPRSDGRRV